jgi:DnaK suppressor protein
VNRSDSPTKRLLEAELDETVERLQREARIPRASLAGSDFLDVAQGVERQELARLSVSRLTERAKRLQVALSRVSSGEYGVCSECGTSISLRRLRAVPDVTTCVTCQHRLERAGHRNLDARLSLSRSESRRERGETR